jgi:hypothetical protein
MRIRYPDAATQRASFLVHAKGRTLRHFNSAKGTLSINIEFLRRWLGSNRTLLAVQLLYLDY